MSVYMTIFLFVLGLVFIIKGGDWFVDSSIWTAKVTGIPSIIIGATIVSFATTLPELLVSTSATLKGSTDIAIGNAIGSTICNIGLIAGIILFFKPREVSKKAFGKKGFLMIGVTLLVVVLAFNNEMNKVESALLLSTIALFFYINIKLYKDVSRDDKEITQPSRKDILENIIKFVLGSAFIILGSNLLVTHGIELAKILNVPESIIGLTLIAFGTSLPELVTGITAILKDDSDIGIGNILGANILNIAMIIGTSGLIVKDTLVMTMTDVNILNIVAENVPQTLYYDIPFSLIFMLVLVLPGVIKGKMYKSQGVVLLFLYVLYTGILVNLT